MADDTFTKSDLDKAVADAVAKVEETLGKKRDELLDEVKELKAAARKAVGIKPEDMAALESEIDQLKVKLVTAEKAVKEALGGKEKAEKALETESGYNRKLLVENGLREALSANGVNHAVHQKAAMALLSGQVQVTVDGDNRVAKVADKALGDFVKEWAAGEEGKHFVSAANNSGGGAGGGSNRGGSGAKTMTRSAYAALSQDEKAQLGQQMTKGELRLVDDGA